MVSHDYDTWSANMVSDQVRRDARFPRPLTPPPRPPPPALPAPPAPRTFTSMRKFNTAGPIRPALDYHIPPLERLDLAEVLEFIRDERYFVLHAPRQTGKTSALLALRGLLNGGTVGEYRCAYINVEIGADRT